MDPLRSVAESAPAQRAFSLVDEFKRFAFKGNVIDLAVGVIIGAAFGKIVDSLVKHLIMPAISLLMPAEQSYLQWQWRGIPFGLFLGEVLNFLIVSFALYLFVVKFLGLIVKQKQEAAPPPLTKDQQLLIEIRDLLKERTG